MRLKTSPIPVRRYTMSEVPPASSGGGADAAIAKMEATFNMAIEKSARPNNGLRTDAVMRAAARLLAFHLPH
jgi:hypothetical protein